MLCALLFPCFAVRVASYHGLLHFVFSICALSFNISSSFHQPDAILLGSWAPKLLLFEYFWDVQTIEHYDASIGVDALKYVLLHIF